MIEMDSKITLREWMDNIRTDYDIDVLRDISEIASLVMYNSLADEFLLMCGDDVSISEKNHEKMMKLGISHIIRDFSSVCLELDILFLRNDELMKTSAGEKILRMKEKVLDYQNHIEKAVNDYDIGRGDVKKELYMEGDIIITDPFYVTDFEGRKFYKDKDCKGIYSNTIYGDWGCRVYRIDKNGRDIFALGDFCADCGEVFVSTLSEIRKYNPGVCSENNSWQTVIPDFHGIVSIVHVLEKDNTRSCHVEGHGNIDFISRQIEF